MHPTSLSLWGKDYFWCSVDEYYTLFYEKGFVFFLEEMNEHFLESKDSFFPSFFGHVKIIMRHGGCCFGDSAALLLLYSPFEPCSHTWKMAL